MLLTDEQEAFASAVINAVTNPTNKVQAFFAQAGPGSGKTSTLEALFSRLPPCKVVASSFTKSATDSIKRKFIENNTQASQYMENPHHATYQAMHNEGAKNTNGAMAFFPNLNVLGFAQLRGSFPNVWFNVDSANPQRKWYNAVNQILDKLENQTWDEKMELRTQVIGAINAIREDLLDMNDSEEVCRVLEERGIIKSCFVADWAIGAIKADIAKLRGIINLPKKKSVSSGKMVGTKFEIDFIDQYFIPCHMECHKMEGAVKFRVVFIDEFQNQSNGRIQIGLNHLTDDGVFVALGDPFQSIMEFAGASPDLWEQTVQKLGAEEHRLTKSYRFGVNIASKLQFMAEIDGCNTTVADKIQYEYVMPKSFLDDSAILTRTNAQLIEIGLWLHNQDIPIMFVNTRVADETISFLEMVHKEFNGDDVYDSEKFGDFINTRAGLKSAYMSKYAPRPAIENMSQQHKVAEYLVRNIRHTRYQDLFYRVQNILSSRVGVNLVTAHSSQSAEYDHLLIIPDHFYNIVRRMIENEESERSIYGEAKLYYVALSRAKESITFVEELFPVDPDHRWEVAEKVADFELLPMYPGGITQEDNEIARGKMIADEYSALSPKSEADLVTLMAKAVQIGRSASPRGIPQILTDKSGLIPVSKLPAINKRRQLKLVMTLEATEGEDKW